MSSIIWFAAILFFLVLELLTPTTLVAVWFIAGALGAFLVSLFCDIVWLQVVVFTVISVAALLITRPLVRRRQGKVPATNADMVIGMKGRVVQEIPPEDVGRVHVNGLDWAARCSVPLKAGQWCQVDAIHGATLTVHPIDIKEETNVCGTC